MPNPSQPIKVTFTNIAPEDTEWTAGINLLNNWTEPERYLRHIVQYIRSGKHYPADMHVDLIKQIIDAEVKHAEKTTLAYAVHVGYAIKELNDTLRIEDDE